jgi:hypothetical protein
MSLYSKQDYRDAGHGVMFWAFVVGLIILAGIVIKLVFFPAELISKTFDADRAIRKYEWFHEAAAQIDAKRNDISAHTALVAQSFGTEKNRLMIEKAGMQQACRDLVARYNAESTKVNSVIFKGMSAPNSFSLTTCD